VGSRHEDILPGGSQRECSWGSVEMTNPA
jgi:hypothetical protein